MKTGVHGRKTDKRTLMGVEAQLLNNNTIWILRNKLQPELKPCPFCGGLNVSVLDDQEWGIWSVGCKDCHIGTCSICTSRADAVAVWNRRTP